jgi:hypothetical protein
MTEDGWVYFCRQCMVYKPESEFYKRSDSSFGVDYRCKIHRKTPSVKSDPSMSYLKLHTLRDSDFVETEKVLNSLGYKICPTCDPVWEQFNKRHNLK